MEIRVGATSYRLARPMNAFVQLDVMSRVSPLLASGFGEVVPMVLALKQLGVANIAEIEVSKLATILVPVSRELSKMTDVDRRFVFAACLTCLDRKGDSDKGWSRIWNDAAGAAMFDDINSDAFLVIRLALGVMQETFKSFFPASLSALIGGASS